MNNIVIAGHLGSDPEVRFTSTGKKVTTLRVATRTRRNGADDTIWYRVSIWGEQFDKMLTYLKKGSPVVVIGELQKPEIFTDRDGKPQISLNITASSIQFSPFGKPDRPGQEGSENAAPSTGAASFAGATAGASRENQYSYGAGIQSGKAAPSPSTGEDTFPDEVPF